MTTTADRACLDLAGLTAEPARAVEVPPEAIASVLTEVSAQEARLGTVKAILAARLAAPAAPANGRHEDDLLTDVQEVARLVRRSESWVRKSGHKLPASVSRAARVRAWRGRGTRSKNGRVVRPPDPFPARYARCIPHAMTGTDVQRMRRRLGLTQAELAARLGVHTLTVSRWECDRVRVTEPMARLLTLLRTAMPKPGRSRR